MSRTSVLKLAAQLAKHSLAGTSTATAGLDVSCSSAWRTTWQLTSLRNWTPAAGTAARCLHSPSSSVQQEAVEPQAESTSSAKNPAHNAPMPPWTPTKDLTKRKVYTKRMGFMLQTLEKEQEERLAAERKHPHFGPGDVLQLKLVVPENKRRPAIFKGICIARFNRGVRTTFTLRNYLGNAGGVERSFPLYSPVIQEIQVLESRKVRRAKLYYLRDRQPKEYRV